MMYYYGCWVSPGHYLFDTNGHRVSMSEIPVAIARRIDGGFCPEIEDPLSGTAELHHVGGWTVLAFWDRSSDTRPSSHSTFVCPYLLGFREMVDRCRNEFPTVWNRKPFETVTNVSKPESELNPNMPVDYFEKLWNLYK